MSDIPEIAKLSAKQLMVIFAAALPFVALPILYLFVVDLQLFKDLDASKLLLLGFSSGVPIVVLIAAASLLQDHAGRTSMDLRTAFLVACTSSIPIYGIFFYGILVTGSKSIKVGTTQQFVTAPIALSILVFILLLVANGIISWRRRERLTSR